MAIPKTHQQNRRRYMATVLLLVIGIILNIVIRRAIAGWPPDGGTVPWAVQTTITVLLAIGLGWTLNDAERKRAADKRAEAEDYAR